MNELAHFLAQQVKALGAAPAKAARPKAQVWIADPTDDVLDRWDSLASALRQEGCEVLPAAPGGYPVNPEQDFRAALEADVSQAQLLVQLLGPYPGRRPLGRRRRSPGCRRMLRARRPQAVALPTSPGACRTSSSKASKTPITALC